MPESHTVIPLSPLRKVISARMTEAKRTIPHFRIVADIEMDALLTMRDNTNVTRADAKVSVNDCVVKACASALMEHPGVNIQFTGDAIHQYHNADISVVIAIDGGLTTPVIRQANKKSVREIAAEVKTLAARAAKGQLRMDEIVGGSFSISNLGAYGVHQFDAIINPPQCAILAVGRAKARIVAATNGEIRTATVLRATLSVDHRTVDGATAAAFMATLSDVLQQPRQIFLTTEEN